MNSAEARVRAKARAGESARPRLEARTGESVGPGLEVTAGENLRRRASRRPRGGYTLVELMAVLAIMAILASAGTAVFRGYVERARTAEAYEKGHRILDALRIVESEYGGDGGMGAEILRDPRFFLEPGNPDSVLYPYIGEDAADCTGYTVRFRRNSDGGYQVSGFTYETETYVLRWKVDSEFSVERKQSGT